MRLAVSRCVHMWAPGADIMSASHLSDVATEYRSGTSQAVPFVAGAAALYLENVTGRGSRIPERDLQLRNCCLDHQHDREKAPVEGGMLAAC